MSKRAFWLWYAVFALFSGWIVFWNKYMPMVDLPQHAAQVAILRHYNDPAFGFSGVFNISWFTPYASAYYLAWLFSFLMPVGVAMKAVVFLSILLMPLSLRALLRDAGLDIAWALIGFPMGFGYGFLWGLFSFQIGVPVGVFSMAFAFRYARNPTVSNGAWLAGLALLSFFSHAVVFVVCSVLNAYTILVHGSRFTPFWARFVPLAAPVPIVAFWYLNPLKKVPGVKSLIDWARDNPRLQELPDLLLSVQWDRPARWAAFGLLIGVLAGWRPARQNWRRLGYPLIALGFYFLSPNHVFGHSLIYSRLPVFVMVAFLLFFGATGAGWRRTVAHALVLAVCAGWLHVVSGRIAGFNVEAADYDTVMARTEPNKRLMALIHDRSSSSVPCEPFYHFAAWYQVEKGGVLGYSIAYLYNVVAQYRAGREPLPLHLGALVWAAPNAMNWNDYGRFDYYLVRGSADAEPEFFTASRSEAELMSHQGRWWLYARKGASQ